MTRARCAITDCQNPVDARRWCQKHYKRWRRHGHPEYAVPGTRRWTLAEIEDLHSPILWDAWHNLIRQYYVHEETRCWVWTGSKNADGYASFGCFGIPGLKGHVIMYRIFKGDFPGGLELDHLCRNRTCVNPDHLEPVTTRENILKGNGFGAINARKTHCPKGHPYAGDNLYLTKIGRRRCRTCMREERRHVAKPKNPKKTHCPATHT